eukprot:5654531-Prymnesium_polylepis.1
MRPDGALTVAQYHHRKALRGEQSSRVKRRRAIKASSRTVEFIDADSMSEASASRRRAALQWICVAGVHRALKARQPS